jgi:hypothetical protein
MPMSPDNVLQPPSEPEVYKDGLSLLLLSAACLVVQVAALAVSYRYGHHHLQIWVRVLVFAAALPGIALIARRPPDWDVYSRAHTSLLISAYVIVSFASLWLLVLGLASFGNVGHALWNIFGNGSSG